MIESRNWSRWLARLSSGFVAATGMRAGPQAEIVCGSDAQPLRDFERPVHLSGNASIRLRHARAAQVRAVRGNVWVTQDGDPRDIVLKAGETFRLDRDDPVLIVPFGSAEVALTAAPHG